MVFGVDDRRRLADGVEDDEVVFAASGNAVDDHVRYRHMSRAERLLGARLVGLSGLDLFGEFLRLRQHRWTLLFGSGAHLFAYRLLFGAQVVGGRNRGPAGGVGLAQGVDKAGILTSGAL